MCMNITRVAAELSRSVYLRGKLISAYHNHISHIVVDIAELVLSPVFIGFPGSVEHFVCLNTDQHRTGTCRVYDFQ